MHVVRAKDAGLPLSFTRRVEKGATRAALLQHVAWPVLIAIGFFLNLYPRFDFATVRIPSVLSRIGLCYLLAGSFIVVTARFRDGAISLRPVLIAAVTAFILLSYWVLLYLVPVPGFGAPGFDPVGSWPTVIDRAVIGVGHLFPYWPVDWKVVFDPEGILSTWPACFNLLRGALVGIAYARGQFKQPAFSCRFRKPRAFARRCRRRASLARTRCSPTSCVSWSRRCWTPRSSTEMDRE